MLAIVLYPTVSSKVASRTGFGGSSDLTTEVFIFLLLIAIPAVVILGTGFRHRVRRWIRQHVFAEQYDYRQYWIEATERVRSIDSIEDAATALSDIIHRALGAVDIGVWIRKRDPNRLVLLANSGSLPVPVKGDVNDIIEKLFTHSEPLSGKDLDALQNMKSVKAFMEDTYAALLVPLTSSNQLVGLLTLGPDRGGHSYGWESREFLRVLAGHAAGEFHKSELLSTLVTAKEAEAFRMFSTFLLHDLKNFASTLSLIAQNASRYQDNLEFQRDAFNSVLDTAEKIKRLCNSLRSFSSNLAADKKLSDLNQTVRSIADNLNTEVQRRLTFDPGQIVPVLVDREELERVLQNLLINACEAIAEDGHITIRTARRDNTVVLSVEDNGKGMSREFMEKDLFLPFHTTKSEGLGIGLFQSKKIMEAHKGSIHIESEEGKGTTVHLVFPVERHNS